MANLTESSVWESTVYQLATTDAVQGGAGGVSNCQPQQLTNRTKKIYDTLVTRGVFINVSDQVFVGQPVIVDATFEGTVSDGDIVYYNISNVQFEKAIADGSAAQNAVGLADVTNSKILSSGLVDTGRSDTPGDILFLSDTVAGTITTSDTGVPIGRYQYDGIVFMSPAAAAAAASATIAPGSITPDKLSEHYYTDTEIDAKCTNWDTAYTDRRHWDGGSSNLDASVGRTSLGLTGDVTTHCHDGMYYTETEIDAKCTNWDTAYTQTRQWDGGPTGLNQAQARTSLELTGSVTTHCHCALYYSKAEINAKCGNWDTAYGERRQWDGSATNLNASNGRTNLGLTGDVTTHCHDGMYYTEAQIDGFAYARKTIQNLFTARNCFCQSTYANTIYAYNNRSASDTFTILAGVTTGGCGAIKGTHSIRCGVLGTSAGGIYGSGGDSSYGVYGNVTTSGNGVVGCSSSGYGVYGNSTSGSAVAGNTAYYNTSSKYMKILNDICISECIKANPIGVYKYYWEDSNYTGFDKQIGPTAEDFNNTFNLYNSNPEEYDGIWSLDGIAFGLGIENLQEIDKLKQIIVELYSCIQKLEK